MTLMQRVKKIISALLMILGAGDADNYMTELTNILKNK